MTSTAKTTHHQQPLRTTILLVNLGTPKAASYIETMRFLRTFLSDPRVINLPKLLWYPILYGIILPFRSLSSMKKYQKIVVNNKLPLQKISQDLCALVNEKVGAEYSILKSLSPLSSLKVAAPATIRSLYNSTLESLAISLEPPPVLNFIWSVPNSFLHLGAAAGEGREKGRGGSKGGEGEEPLQGGEGVQRDDPVLGGHPEVEGHEEAIGQSEGHELPLEELRREEDELGAS